MKSRGVLVCFAMIVALGAATPAWAQHSHYYILDGYGGVHSGDGAPIITSAPYFGWDIARDIAYVPVGTATSTGDGMLVLDGFGGAHPAGALIADPPGTAPPYFGFDIARGIVTRNVPPRVDGASYGVFPVLDSTTWVNIESATVHAPVDGFLFVAGSVNLYCADTGNANAQIGVNVDGLNQLDGYFFDAPDCTDFVGDRTDNVAITTLFPVTAGSHTANLVGQRTMGTADVYTDGTSIVALFVARDGQGDLMLPGTTVAQPRPASPRRDR